MDAVKALRLSEDARRDYADRLPILEQRVVGMYDDSKREVEQMDANIGAANKIARKKEKESKAAEEAETEAKTAVRTARRDLRRAERAARRAEEAETPAAVGEVREELEEAEEAETPTGTVREIRLRVRSLRTELAEKVAAAEAAKDKRVKAKREAILAKKRAESLDRRGDRFVRNAWARIRGVLMRHALKEMRRIKALVDLILAGTFSIDLVRSVIDSYTGIFEFHARSKYMLLEYRAYTSKRFRKDIYDGLPRLQPLFDRLLSRRVSNVSVSEKPLVMSKDLTPASLVRDSLVRRFRLVNPQY